MKDSRHIGFQIKPRRIWVCGVSCIVLMSCTSIPAAVDLEEVDNSEQAEKFTYENTLREASSTRVNQIGDEVPTLNTAQIVAKFDPDKFTVEQLKAYADRCSPGAIFPPPQGLDCSEVNLRMKRLLRSDDRVTDALVTLDRLGRNNTVDDTVADLKKGQPGNSFDSQAIAGGILDPATPLPIEPEEDLEDFLNENGLSVPAGAIIAAQR